VTAFRKGSSPYKNALRHIGSSVVVTADLSDFFGSITLQDVIKLFLGLGAERQVSVTLARLTTLDERLVQGGRASPFIANLVGSRLDEIVLAQAKKGCRYTRYVDDLTFSGDKDVVPTAAEVRTWVEQAAFRLRPGSCRVTSKEGGPYVTGLHVGGEYPQIPRRLRRQIDRFLHFAKEYDVESAALRTFRASRFASDPRAALLYVQGLAHWLEPINGDLSGEWRAQVSELRS
jgi:RNA-directed DNA polymerase